jgi:hypothetical protein
MNLDSPVSLGGMMVTPSASHEEIKSQKDIEDIYIIEENNNKYEFTLKLIDDKLNIENKTKLKEGEERIYINSFNFEELKSIHKFFFICNNINDALNYIKNILEEKKVSIQTITDDEILINLKLKVIKEEAIIKIKLLRKEDSQNDLLNELNLVKKENKDLKERFEKIEKYMNEIDKKRSLRGEKTIKDISDETIFFPSKIIIDEYDKLLILRKLEGKNKKVQAIDLLFRSSRDGDNLENIKKAIDKRKNVLAVLKTTKGRRFAGFTEKGYNFSKSEGEDENAFLISFDNYRAYDYEKYVLNYQIGFYFIQRDRNTYSSVFTSCSCPFFFQNNGNIYIPNDFYSKNCRIERVECPKWNQILELNLNEEKFNIKELEYFQIHVKE